MNYTLLNTKSCLDCTEEELDNHNSEIDEIINSIYSYCDYKCALICKYQDKAHKNQEQQIIGSCISQLNEELERFDLKNGVDILLGDDGYLCFMVYGQGYTYKEEYHLITMTVKIMPYDKNEEFISFETISKGIELFKTLS